LAKNENIEISGLRIWKRSQRLRFSPRVLVEGNLKYMGALQFNYWLAKFIQEVVNKKGRRYPQRTIQGRSQDFSRETHSFPNPPTPDPQVPNLFQVTCLKAWLCCKPSVFTVDELTTKSRNFLSPFLVRLHVQTSN